MLPSSLGLIVVIVLVILVLVGRVTWRDAVVLFVALLLIGYLLGLL